MQQGRKFDGGKLRYDLVPVLAYEEVTKVLTAGSLKYDDNNWQKVPKGRQRYLAAALRHIQDYRKGHVIDDGEGGTNTHTLANAITDLMFILEKDLQGWPDEDEPKDTLPFPVSVEDSHRALQQWQTPAWWSQPTPAIPKPWYPDDSGEWVELPPDNAVIPFELGYNENVQVLYQSERDDRRWSTGTLPAQEWYWDREEHGTDEQIIAYKVV